MTARRALVLRILEGRSDANIRFAELLTLLRNMGFTERIRGSHHVFRREGIAERVTLQRDNGMAKPYQVRQIRRLLLKYDLESRP
ncbi:MAG: type II toxin-antitoxin system HicA family toxin [Acidobacteriota bacterium]|nr:type II toxin-antitoxin system HicA family toxin [Acidobacteriota bacterium]